MRQTQEMKNRRVQVIKKRLIRIIVGDLFLALLLAFFALLQLVSIDRAALYFVYFLPLGFIFYVDKILIGKFNILRRKEEKDEADIL